MRKGNNPAILLDRRNRLFAIGTGSDATSEHEGGSDELMYALSGCRPLDAAEVAHSLANPTLKEKVLAAFKLSKSGMPDLFEGRVIRTGLENLVFHEARDGAEPTATLLYCAGRQLAPDNSFVAHELTFPHPRDTFAPQDLAGAWDCRSFGFKVKGAKKVEQLREFVAAMREGKCMFAGKFLAEGKERLGGVIIARADLLRPEHRAAMAKAQAEFEGKVRLYMKSRVPELQELRRQFAPHKTIFALKPAWLNGEEAGDVGYCINTGAIEDDWGPHSFERVASWLRSGASKRLRAQEPA